MRSLARVPFAAIGALGFAIAFSASARAQEEETSIPIELGSSRIGGPGLTTRERAAVKAWSTPEEYVTEDNLPAKGHRKRLPSLHVLAERYHDSKQWKDACLKYDTIVEEEGEEGLDLRKDGRRYAARSYLRCAKIAMVAVEFEKAEALLQKSERFGPSDHRHKNVRNKILREQYRKKLANGDVDAAIGLFEKAQAQREDEDERIWLGEQLATLAWQAYESKDELRLEDLMKKLESYAPMNTEYRRLKDKIETEEAVLGNAFGMALAALAFVGGATWFSRWRAKQKVKKMMGGPFDDVEDSL